MDDVRWNNYQLRNHLDTEALNRYDDVFDRRAARERFRTEVRVVLAPRVQDLLLAKIGILADLDGLAMVCYDLVDDLRWKHQVRRWALVCDEPWDYLAQWSAEEVRKAYRATAGKKKPKQKVLKEIERANS